MALTAPVGLISFVLVCLAASLVDRRLALAVGLAWLVSGALVFHRGTEAAIARHLMHLRRPTTAEYSRLAPVWAEVTRRAGVRQDAYELWVEESPGLNAVAAAGHIVAVTRTTLDTLPNSQLGAVLAHELGHHVGGHAWAGMLAYWYALPARTSWGFIRNRLRGALRRLRRGQLRSGCLLLLLVGPILMILATTWWATLLLFLTPFLLAALSRRAEFIADAYSAHLGFAPQLIEVLTLLQDTEALEDFRMPTPGAWAPAKIPAPHQRQGATVPAQPERGLAARLLDRHPDVHSRLHRLAAVASYERR